MTPDGPGQELVAPGRAAGESRPLAVSQVIDLCDRIVGERGRREHRFAWLRGPESAPDGWLAVDAYYPAGRLVVVYRQQPAAHDHLYGELIPARGLRLLTLSGSQLPSDPAAAESALRRLIADAGPAPPRTVEPPLPRGGVSTGATDTPIGRLAAALSGTPRRPAPTRRPAGASQIAAAERGARFVAAHKTTAVRRAPSQPPQSAPRRRTVPPRAAVRHEQIRPVGIAFGLALAALVLAEAYLGVVRVGLEGGQPALGFGLALDAGARALGAVAAGRTGEPGWSWWCALGGSPVVAVFALFRAQGPVRVDPGPLAGLVAVLAVLVVVMSLALRALGI